MIRLDSSPTSGAVVAVQRITSLTQEADETFADLDVPSGNRLNPVSLRTLYRLQEGVDLIRRLFSRLSAERLFTDTLAAGLSYGDNVVATTVSGRTAWQPLTVVQWSVNNPAVAEGGNATFTITRADNGQPAAFSYVTSDVSAFDGTDYTGVAGVGTINPASTFNIVVSTVDRPGLQGDRTFTLEAELT
jgi:hypothetical protein